MLVRCRECREDFESLAPSLGIGLCQTCQRNHDEPYTYECTQCGTKFVTWIKNKKLCSPCFESAVQDEDDAENDDTDWEAAEAEADAYHSQWD